MILFCHIWLKTAWIASPKEDEVVNVEDEVVKEEVVNVKAPDGRNRLP